MLKTFPQIDAIVQGDGEPAIHRLALASVGADHPDLMPNVVTRGRVSARRTALSDLATAPTPDFDDWFADVAALEKNDKVTITTRSLPLEGSRGCWWGQTSHCTFCGIDDWFKDLFARIPTIYHLVPPISRSLVQITRFAPLQAYPWRFDISVRATHDWRYDVMFSKDFLRRSGMQLDNYAYCFKRTFDTPPELAEAHRILVHQIEHWKNQHRRRDVMLFWERTQAGARFTDSRFGPPVLLDVDEVVWRVYKEFDRNPRSVSDVRRALSTEGIAPDAVDAALEHLVAERLVWREGRQALGLALPADVMRAHSTSNWKAEWISLRE
ncbi:hypothetical protein [Streptomyces sp. NPDC005408]|uniref:hypothetical protein n=1 Tax=Streptomyces sp. NPDC005408 TaxID=3155341 RepID=UPI0033B82E89